MEYRDYIKSKALVAMYEGDKEELERIIDLLLDSKDEVIGMYDTDDVVEGDGGRFYILDPTPVNNYKVFLRINDIELNVIEVKAESEVDAVLKWYSESGAKGSLEYDKDEGTWSHEGTVIGVENLD